MELLLIGNAGEDSIRTGEWDFQAVQFASLDELDIEPSIRLPMEAASVTIGLMRGTIDAAEIDARYKLFAGSIEDTDLASSLPDMLGWAAFASGRFADAAASWLENADVSALNAPYSLPRVAHMALLAGDPSLARRALERLAQTSAQGKAIDVDRTAIAAGLAALEGRHGEALAGYRAAIAGWRDLGLPWDEAVTSIEFVRFLGPDEPEASAAADAARSILERLEASRVLDILDASIELGHAARRPSAGTDRRADAGGRDDRRVTGVPILRAAVFRSGTRDRPPDAIPPSTALRPYGIRQWAQRGVPTGKSTPSVLPDHTECRRRTAPTARGRAPDGCGAEWTRTLRWPAPAQISRRRVARGRPPARRRRRRSRSAARSAGRASTSARLVTPVSMKMQRAPTARAAARSVAIPSPIMIASPGSRPTAWAAASSRYGAGLPIETGTTPVAASTRSRSTRHPGRSPRSVG